MRKYENMRTADIVVEELLDWKVDTIFGLPGDGINGFIEALRRRQDKINFILVRHEESAAFMACAYAKYTGKLGACVATSGPGAIHLLNGLYDAKGIILQLLQLQELHTLNLIILAISRMLTYYNYFQMSQFTMI